MAVEEFRDLLRLLEQRPEWRAELRRLVLTDELLALPGLVRELAEAQRQAAAELAALQRRTEERFQRVEAQLGALVAAQEHMQGQLAALAEAERRTAAALAKFQRQTEARLAALEGRVDRLEERVAELADRMVELTGVVRTLALDVAELKGEALERRYRERAHSYFAPILRRARVLEGAELWSVLDAAVERGQLTEAEAEEVAQADVVVRGRRREDGEEAYLVVEVSWGVGPQDVLRARERARLLARAGLPALPAVAGRAVTEEAGRLALAEGVWQVTDGRVVPPAASGPTEP